MAMLNNKMIYIYITIRHFHHCGQRKSTEELRPLYSTLPHEMPLADIKANQSKGTLIWVDLGAFNGGIWESPPKIDMGKRCENWKWNNEKWLTAIFFGFATYKIYIISLAKILLETCFDDHLVDSEWFWQDNNFIAVKHIYRYIYRTCAENAHRFLEHQRAFDELLTSVDHPKREALMITGWWWLEHEWMARRSPETVTSLTNSLHDFSEG